MRRVLKGMLFSFLFLLFVLLLLPREQAWYKLEQILIESKISIDKEQLHSNVTTLNVEQGDIYFSELILGHFESLSITPMLLFDRLTLTDFKAGEDMKMFEGMSIEHATLTHSLLAPLMATITANGSFGSLTGTIDRVGMDLLITPSTLLLKNTLLSKYLTKTPKGYTYAIRF